MADYNYITTSDLTSVVSSDFNCSGYISQANDEVECVAISLGISNTADIYQTPLHPVLKKYAVNYAYAQLYLDKFGANNTDNPANDKYMALYNTYNELAGTYRKSLTSEMITGDADTPNEVTAGTIQLFRS